MVSQTKIILGDPFYDITYSKYGLVYLFLLLDFVTCCTFIFFTIQFGKQYDDTFSNIIYPILCVAGRVCQSCFAAGNSNNCRTDFRRSILQFGICHDRSGDRRRIGCWRPSNGSNQHGGLSPAPGIYQGGTGVCLSNTPVADGGAEQQICARADQSIL